MVPDFLSIPDVLAIHRDRIGRYGGAYGLRSRETLEAAAAPQATFGGEFLHLGVPQMAAAYLWHLVRDHPFVDGNKRTGLAAALVFLHINGYAFEAQEPDVEALVWAVARDEADEQRVADFFRLYVGDAEA